MAHFRRILVGADFSEYSLQAFKIACSLAREGQTGLIVLHVVELTPVVEQVLALGSTGAPIFQPPGGHQEALKDHLREVYVPDCSLQVEYRAREGPPAAEILRTASENLCDLVVLGTHGRTGLTRLVAGSVAETVMRKAGCPVLTVRLPGA
jgi:nucleotide-binding universal stress UspA family protein